MASCRLLQLPDNLLLKILQYLDVEDVLKISTTNERFENLSTDRDIVRCVLRLWLLSTGAHIFVVLSPYCVIAQAHLS